MRENSCLRVRERPAPWAVVKEKADARYRYSMFRVFNAISHLVIVSSQHSKIQCVLKRKGTQIKSFVCQEPSCHYYKCQSLRSLVSPWHACESCILIPRTLQFPHWTAQNSWNTVQLSCTAFSVRCTRTQQKWELAKRIQEDKISK